ncbi:MAG: AAA family ATPase, partial [Rhodospirillaceae bacterium]
MSAPAPMPIASASSPAKAARPAFLATAADEVTRSLLSKTAGLRGLSGERVVIGGVPEVTKALAGTPTPRLLIIDFSKSADPAADADALADVCDPGTLVIGLGTVNDVGLYRYLTGLGLSDYLVKPCSVEMLSDAIERAEQDAEAEALRGTVKPEVDPSNKTRKIMVTASRGGAGAGTVALSLAWLFSHHHQRNSVLVDLDLEFGTAALALDLQPGRGLADALAAPDRVDALFLDRAMLKDGEHFSLLATEQALDGAEALNADSVSTLIKALAEGRDRLVLDTPRRFLAENPYIAADMDALVLVTDLSIAGMRDTLRLANLIKA